MKKAEIVELIQNGENSSVEFKRDDIHPDKLAAEMVALLNLQGGHILLGVEDNKTVSGLTRDRIKAEEWVMQTAREHIQPATIPHWETVVWDNEKLIGIVSLPADAPDKPYKAKRGPVWTTKIRAGTETRNASREEEQRLYQRSGQFIYGYKPVLGTAIDALDSRRLRDYFTRILEGDAPPNNNTDEWQTLLCNRELATKSSNHVAATVDGMLLFGTNPGRFLPQSGIRAICYPGAEPDYATRADEVIKGPMVPLGALEDGSSIEPGIVDRAWDFVRRNTNPTARLVGARRVDSWDFPEEAVRETLVNAVVHRDYSIAGTDIMLSIFSNRLEVVSPGRLPNTITPASMKSGMRYACNQTLVNVMRDYGYVEVRGMGVFKKILPAMRAHNGTEPDLIEEEYRFTVRLWKNAQPAYSLK